MTWVSRAITTTGLVLLAHACYSATEHSVISSTAAQHVSTQQLTTNSLPVDISIETLVATLIVCLGLVIGSPSLRPIRWQQWAGEIEREGEARFTAGSGEAEETEFHGNPFSVLETRPSFTDIRKQRREFADWVKSNNK